MKHDDIIVVIPVYKSIPSHAEGASLCQSLKVLHKYPICLIAPASLDLDWYQDIFSSKSVTMNVERFENSFFAGIAGYNSLMLCMAFYERFASYKYMLIDQLDAWVFRDELLEWSNKGFDYIGAPWCETENGKEMWSVGNGGLSLRRVAYFLDLFRTQKPAQNIKQLLQSANGWADMVKLPLKALGIKNTPKDFIARMAESFNEDIIYSKLMRNTLHAPTTPTHTEALGFAMELDPKRCYTINGCRLPFGCHAFEKNDFETFWSQHIDLS